MSPTPDASSLVPTVDLSAPTATELTAVDAACRDHGFFLLVGHGAEQLIADMWRITEAFFAQDETVKGSVRRTVDNPFGYWDRELTKRKRDHKEVFDYADPSGPTGHLNRWPAGYDEFRTTLTEFYDTFTTERVNVSGDDQNPVFQNKQYGKTEHKYLPGSLGPVIGHPRTDADTRLQGTVTSDGTTLTGIGTAFLSSLQKGDALYICELADNTKHVVTVSDTVESDTSVPIVGGAFGDAYAWVGRISFPWVRNLQPDCYTVMRIRQCATLKSFTPALDRAFYMIPNTASDYSTIKPFLPVKYFSPTLGRLNELTIEFLNADGSPYDFMGRNHTLLFRVEHHRQNVNYGDF